MTGSSTPRGIATLGFALDDAQWHRIENRDAAADGTLYFGVRTTGVYCRPSCR
ncbi:MAG: Ada metal-binding domain-containing protein, partial [Azospirillaceae bacterium]|nr:Ada metal-binding domain-containing protein [Azospirillaceae bacterium]